MNYLGKALCLEFSELVPDVFSKKNYDYHRANGNIKVHGIGGNGRNVYVEYESLPPKYKQKVIELFGCPYQTSIKQPILNAIEFDQNAFNYYSNYVLHTGNKLPSSDFDLQGNKQINYVQRYTNAANWLNMLRDLTSDKTRLKQDFNVGVMEFWDVVLELIKNHDVKLPASRKHLLPKLKEYINNGYEVLIEQHKFGNNYGAKVATKTQQAYLFKLLSLRNKHDYVEIALEYNNWARENNCQTITPEAVAYRAKKWHLKLSLERDGVAKTVTKYSKQIQRTRPSAPLLLINSDDNVLDIYYKTSSTDWYRPVLYVVIDAFNDYILGYAIGDTVTNELIKEAYRNANRHIMELTGGSYQWHQLQTDRWGISAKNTTELEHFYRSLGVFTPAALKNSQSKYIERSFGTVWHKTLKKLFPSNYSGHNIDAKQKLNPDTLKPSNFPHIEFAAQQIHAFIEVMRRTTRGNSALNRQQEWLEAFNTSSKSKARLLSEEQRLQLFGKQNLKRNSKQLETNRITSKGVEVTILGEKRVYELSQMEIAKNIGKSINVMYDETDLSHVLITDNEHLKIVAYEYQKVPSAIADYKEGDAERIKLLQSEKKILAPYIQGFIQEREAILERANIDAESRLKAGVLIKEIAHKDQQRLVAQRNGASKTESLQNDDDVNPFKQILNR